MKHLKMMILGRLDENDKWMEVVVMAISDGYAMVRRPGCMPFVVRVEELGPIVD